MENNIICTIYSHYTSHDVIIEILKEVYPAGKINTYERNQLEYIELTEENELLKNTSKLIISYRKRMEPSYELIQADSSPLSENLKGMYGFVSSLESKNKKIKELFLKKIATLNSEFSISLEGNIEKEENMGKLQRLTEKFALELDAVLFVSPDSFISKSKTQHFLNKNLDLIIDIEGNCSIDTLEIVIESKYFDNGSNQLTEDQIRRKEKSEKILKGKNIKFNPHLPCIESEKDTIIRNPKEIAQRVVVLAVTNFVAFDSLTGEKAIDYLKNYNLWDFATPMEREFLLNPIPKRKQEETWKCECIWVLMWALKKIDAMNFPSDMCNLNDISPEDYPVGGGKDPNDFINSMKASRTKEEIMDMNDLYYRFDWACVDARIQKKELKELHSGVVYERHYALNWLVNYMRQEWDEITCDT